ncbi:MAG TPA: hypothetical protein PL032_10140 [Syntrophorhabdus sp.]|nr:hypothetical protein [Syntrophorhabdus sp.]
MEIRNTGHGRPEVLGVASAASEIDTPLIPFDVGHRLKIRVCHMESPPGRLNSRLRKLKFKQHTVDGIPTPFLPSSLALGMALNIRTAIPY